MLKRVLAALLAALMILSVAMVARAASGTVTYSGNSGSFIFEPGSNHSPTDLFPEFKDVMPGDVLEQWIRIVNKADRNVKIKLYMRALGAKEGSEAFLSQLNLRVEQIGQSDLFDAPANETAQLTDWVCLGTIYSGGEIELNVVLEVPVTLDNNFKNMVGYLDWEFMVEELPVEPDDPEPPPPTGDDSHVYLYAALMVGSVAALILIILKLREKKKED